MSSKKGMDRGKGSLVMKKKVKVRLTPAEINKREFLRIRAARKPPPFLSELDRGVNLDMVRTMWEDEILDDFDYSNERRRITHEKRLPNLLTDRELKEFLRANNAWYPGQPREEMEYMYTYWLKRGTQMLRLKEVCELGSFGGAMENIHKVRDEQISKVDRFQRVQYHHARVCFLTLPGLQNSWNNVPKVVLDQCIMIFDAEIEWVFYKKTTQSKVQKNQKRYEFSEELKELLRTKMEQDMCFWFREHNRKYSHVSDFIERQKDTNTGEKYNPLQLKEFWWKRSWGGASKPPRFTKSETKVITNFQSGSFEFHSVAELIYQSNENIEPVDEYSDEHRKSFEFLTEQNRQRRDLKLKYTTKTPKAIEKLVNSRVKVENFEKANFGPLRGKPTAAPIKQAKKRDIDAEDDAILEAAEKEMKEEKKRQKAALAKKKAEAAKKKAMDEAATTEKQREEEGKELMNSESKEYDEVTEAMAGLSTKELKAGSSSEQENKNTSSSRSRGDVTNTVASSRKKKKAPPDKEGSVASRTRLQKNKKK